jgi:two-component system CheB/CheR fusion protein
METRNQQLIIDIPTELVHLDVDPVRMQQVFVNLLHNASKFTADRGHIWLTAQRIEPATRRGSKGGDRSMVEIRARDDGDGIDPLLLPHVFEAFLQADRSFDRAQGGLGIGLTLVRSLVELHGGTVEAFSDGNGHGSEFVVRLPVLTSLQRREATVTETPQAHVAIQPDSVSRRILVVDDHADARDTLAVLLRSVGHNVQVAAEGGSALHVATTFRPHVVFLDIGLPGMDGFEIARRLRQQHPSDPMVLVALSGYGQDEDRRRSREAGFDHYFTKPVGFQTVRDFLVGLGKEAQGPVI